MRHHRPGSHTPETLDEPMSVDFLKRIISGEVKIPVAPQLTQRSAALATAERLIELKNTSIAVEPGKKEKKKTKHHSAPLNQDLPQPTETERDEPSQHSLRQEVDERSSFRGGIAQRGEIHRQTPVPVVVPLQQLPESLARVAPRSLQGSYVPLGLLLKRERELRALNQCRSQVLANRGRDPPPTTVSSSEQAINTRELQTALRQESLASAMPPQIVPSQTISGPQMVAPIVLALHQRPTLLYAAPVAPQPFLYRPAPVILQYRVAP